MIFFSDRVFWRIFQGDFRKKGHHARFEEGRDVGCFCVFGQTADKIVVKMQQDGLRSVGNIF